MSSLTYYFTDPAKQHRKLNLLLKYIATIDVIGWGKKNMCNSRISIRLATYRTILSRCQPRQKINKVVTNSRFRWEGRQIPDQSRIILTWSVCLYCSYFHSWNAQIEQWDRFLTGCVNVLEVATHKYGSERKPTCGQRQKDEFFVRNSVMNRVD